MKSNCDHINEVLFNFGRMDNEKFTHLRSVKSLHL